MTLPTRDELIAKADDAYPTFIEGATKAQIQALLDVMSGKTVAASLSVIHLMDAAKRMTSLYLDSGVFHSQTGPHTIPGGVTTTGSGPELALDLSALVYDGQTYFEFDPRPDYFPITATWGTDLSPSKPPEGETP